jgi:hypothetical protein
MGKFIKTFDHEFDTLDVSHLDDVIEGRPIELHHKKDGTVDDKPSFAIIIELPNGKNVVGQFSLKSLTECLNELGYDVFSPKEYMVKQLN